MRIAFLPFCWAMLVAASSLSGQELVYPHATRQDLVEDYHGTAALTGAFFSRKGRYLAYGVSHHGSDKQVFYTFKLDGKEKLEDRLDWCKFTSIAWVPDSSGFYYNRYPKPGTVAKEDENKYNRVYWHTTVFLEAGGIYALVNLRGGAEYGNAEQDPDHFKFLYAYSPLHNIAPGVKPPPILVTTADTDDRVVPSHSRKFVAALQHAAKGDNPVLLRVETKAGHGRGKPTAKRIEEAADMYSFIFHHLGME